jgi:hypothetical protein
MNQLQTLSESDPAGQTPPKAIVRQPVDIDARLAVRGYLKLTRFVENKGWDQRLLGWITPEEIGENDDTDDSSEDEDDAHSGEGVPNNTASDMSMPRGTLELLDMIYRLNNEEQASGNGSSPPRTVSPRPLSPHCGSPIQMLGNVTSSPTQIQRKSISPNSISGSPSPLRRKSSMAMRHWNRRKSSGFVDPILPLVQRMCLCTILAQVCRFSFYK